MEGNQKVLYVHITKSIYGLLVSAMLFYKKLVADLTEYGFEANPYDPCVANKMVKGKQLTVSWHVDDSKASHMDPNIITESNQWIKDTYGAIGKVKCTRGKIHEYLGMKLDYGIKGQVSVDMVAYVETMVNSFSRKTVGNIFLSAELGIQNRRNTKEKEKLAIRSSLAATLEEIGSATPLH